MHEREAARQNAPGDSDASALALERDLGSAEPDRVLFPALIRVALGPAPGHQVTQYGSRSRPDWT